MPKNEEPQVETEVVEESTETPETVEEILAKSRGSRSTETEEPEDPGEPVEESEDETEWLIENKFKKDDKGIAALTESYRKLQSDRDKYKTELEQGKDRRESLSAMDEFLREPGNEDIVRAIQARVTQMTDPKPPEKPEDYDALDESIEGSSSWKWRKAHDEYLIQKGRFEARKSESERRKADDEKTSKEQYSSGLLKAGLKEDELQSFEKFMDDPANNTPENHVKIFRLLSGNLPEAEAKKIASAAAIEGNEPKPKKKDKAQEKQERLQKGIMSFSKG